MSRRIAIAALTGGLLAAAAATSVAAPAPKKACNLTVDRTGDATRYFVNGPGGPNVQALDIKSVDIASNAKFVTTVVRVAKLAETEATAPYGMAWRATFKLGELEYYTKVMVNRDKVKTYDFGFLDNAIESSLGTSDGTLAFDLTTSEIRLTVPVNKWANKGAPTVGKKALNISAKSYRAMPRPALDSDSDDATGTAAYTFGAPSCVVVGK